MVYSHEFYARKVILATFSPLCHPEKTTEILDRMATLTPTAAMRSTRSMRNASGIRQRDLVDCWPCRDVVSVEILPSRELTYHPKIGILKMIFLFPRWDMLISWRVYEFLKPRSLQSHVELFDKRVRRLEKGRCISQPKHF